MKVIDLGIYVFPGGTAFCDKSVQINGDYKELAFVRCYGQINYKVKRENLPKDIIERIENESRNYKKDFEESARRLWEIDYLRTYERLMDYVPVNDYKAIFGEKDRNKRLEMLIQIYERPANYEVTA